MPATATLPARDDARRRSGASTPDTAGLVAALKLEGAQIVEHQVDALKAVGKLRRPTAQQARLVTELADRLRLAKIHLDRAADLALELGGDA